VEEGKLKQYLSDTLTGRETAPFLFVETTESKEQFMNESESTLQHTDAIAGDAMLNEGGLTHGAQRASLTPAELTARPALPRGARSAASSPMDYPQPGGGNLYPWWDGVHGEHLADPMLAIVQNRTEGADTQGQTHMKRGIRRSWWHWPTIGTAAVLSVGGVILAVSDSAVGANISWMLRKLI